LRDTVSAMMKLFYREICIFCRYVCRFHYYYFCNLCVVFYCIVLTRKHVFLQLCSGVDENAAGACAQLVFAPIDESFADDAPLLPSGFRVIPLDAKTVSATYSYLWH
jgi:hypothetical protein